MNKEKYVDAVKTSLWIAEVQDNRDDIQYYRGALAAIDMMEQIELQEHIEKARATLVPDIRQLWRDALSEYDEYTGVRHND